ncbi:MAG TPA: carbamoyl-phosphate synthase, partial [Rummeliibacillus sp.]|nr:carbamoyl-phosphate synthase [Rummeliibacillus sp.]
MSDGKLIIDSKMETNSVHQELRALEREMNNFKREMELANYKAMMPFKKQVIEVENSMFKLSKSMGNYTGTNKEFMASVDQLGKDYKKAKDNMINADKMQAVSMIQTAGVMMNMTTQAQRIGDNYARMKNPMLMVNGAGLAVADTMNKIANNGNAAVLSLKMLGPNASMKKLLDMQIMINQGLMRFQMVAMAAAATGAILYGGLHKAAMESNKAYQKSFETMVGNLKKAFEPMVQVFAMIMIPVFNFINAISKMTIEFNKAHPVLAKIIQGILLLVPALTLILSPLAIGIGLWAGMQAALSSVWMLIGPLVTGLAAMSGTVWIVAAAIAGLVGGITYLWKTNESFRAAVISAWDAIKAKAVEVFGMISNLFGMLSPVIDMIAQKFNTIKSAILAAFSGDFSQLGAIFAQIIPSIIAVLVGGIPGLIITAARFIPALAQGITSNTAQLTT